MHSSIPIFNPQLLDLNSEDFFIVLIISPTANEAILIAIGKQLIVLALKWTTYRFISSRTSYSIYCTVRGYLIDFLYKATRSPQYHDKEVGKRNKP